MSRSVWRCPKCQLNQFESEVCRRCHAPRFVRLEELEQPKEEVPESVSKAIRNFSFARRVLLLRTERSLTQRELAAIVGCPRPYISKIENGKCTPLNRGIERLSAALQVPLLALVETDELTFWATVAVRNIPKEKRGSILVWLEKKAHDNTR